MNEANILKYTDEVNFQTAAYKYILLGRGTYYY